MTPNPDTIDDAEADSRDRGTTRRYRIEGMHCTSCASGLQSALQGRSEVVTASVDFTSGLAVVDGPLDPPTTLDLIASRGFSGEILETREALSETRSRMELSQARTMRMWKRRAIIGIGIWIPLEILHWTVGHGGEWPAWVMMLGALVVLVVAGGGFFASALTAARRGGTNMDTLISIGATTAFGWSLIVFVAQRVLPDPGEWAGLPLYFAESAALLGIISLGHFLEAKASARASTAVRDLLELQPDAAERIDESGGTTEVPSSEIETGDLYLLRPGGRVPVDATILEGRSELDESLVTGEPIPVVRGPGDPVVAGTLNGNGLLRLEATVDGRNTTVVRIASLVQNAQSSQAPIQRLADRVSSVFVPTVLTVAAASLLGWGLIAGDWNTGVVSAVTVLIISCPCALGLATPMAVMAGAGEASRRGILIKSAASLESSGRLEAVIFDKTGTLTLGRPRLTGVEIVGSDVDEDAAIALAAAAESGSEHPIAIAMLDEARRRGVSIPEATEFEATPGEGVDATVEGRRVGVRRDAEASCRIELDGVTVARIFVDDEPRADAADAITRLRSMGIGVRMLTGDRAASAKRIGRLVGLAEDEIIAEATPESKLELVARRDRRTAMVGDGINDAAALAAADLGIAMASGTGAAIEAANVVVPADRVGSVPDAIHLARRTLRTIRQNLFFAFFYNTIAIPAAAFGLLGTSGPLIAAGAMACSDISVIGNAIRLRRSLARERVAGAERIRADAAASGT